MDITTSHLEAAIIDQKVAGVFAGTTYAFVAVLGNGGWQLGVAVANEQGYSPIEGKTFQQRAEAKQWADSLNAHIGRSTDTVIDIICSTMGGRRFER